MSRSLINPAFIGKMLVGILLAPSVLGWVQGGHTIEVMSDIGVVLLMFLAGLESDLMVFKKNFKPSMLVAVLGVIVPLTCFSITALWLRKDLSTSFLYDIVFAASSVSITVEVLQEYGKLSTRAGNIILGAAVVDDILAVLILSIFTIFKNGGSNLRLQFGLEICG